MIKKKIKSGENLIGYALIAPWIFGILCFQLWPILHSFLMSFTNYNLLNTPSFIGMENYQKMFGDEVFYQAVKVTFKYVFIAVPAKIVFALCIAMILNMKIKGIGIFRTIYYIPSILGSSIAVAILWKALFVKDGVVNALLSEIGIKGVSWLGNPKYTLFTISLLTVWQFGSSMVVFLAGLKQIPSSLYEAASVDGAGKVAKFINITIPGIMPMMSFNILMQTINAFQMFAAPYTIFNGKGGPLNSSMLYVIYLYQNAFKYFNVGYASSLSWALLIMIAGTALILHLLEKKFLNFDD
ncbi:carbohydrate ABC transporter permease [Lacrimispora sp.]|uniref:carbohydrate ABC transporter permease n=1 Tax=Lacrimispora sp. TaxID=2719234 RepID=UPI0028A73129|nr:sugar ABC transporter permease [Lacrimispora sp.]